MRCRGAFLLLPFLLSAAGLLLPTAAAAGSSTTAPPNIVFVMADDLGWGEVGVYPGGVQVGDGVPIQTPHLDALAHAGTRFTEAYAGYTVCAPSRTTLMTGRHSGSFPAHGLPGTKLDPGQATTLGDVLKAAGYATAIVGKSAPLTKPLAQGFDYFTGQVDQSACHNMYPKVMDFGNGTRNVNLTLNWQPKSRELCMARPDAYNYTVDLFQNRALKWMDAHVSASPDVPFFLYLAFTVPHAGGWGDTDAEQGAPVPTDGRYATSGAKWPDVERDHAGVITYLDGYVGDLVAKLDALGITDNTAVFFASDNGAHKEGGHSERFFNSTGGLKGCVICFCYCMCFWTFSLT